VIAQALTARTLESVLFEFPRNALIADIGGGDGQWSLFLADHGFTNILLADLSPDLLRVAANLAEERKVLMRFLEMDIEKASLPCESDVVLCLGGVLSHCLNYKKGLKNLHASLKPSGVGIISVDSFFEAEATSRFVSDADDLRLLLGEGVSRWFFGSRLPYYTKYFRSQELRNALTECGFTIIAVQSRPHTTPWDLRARFSDSNSLANALVVEGQLAAKTELLDCGYQLEFVIGKG
jgi:2-polyprenyl-3-methyl-5-hydroxy-6-metoxy-1,4-benzoquinol methylase